MRGGRSHVYCRAAGRPTAASCSPGARGRRARRPAQAGPTSARSHGGASRSTPPFFRCRECRGSWVLAALLDVVQPEGVGRRLVDRFPDLAVGVHHVHLERPRAASSLSVPLSMLPLAVRISKALPVMFITPPLRESIGFPPCSPPVTTHLPCNGFDAASWARARDGDERNDQHDRQQATQHAHLLRAAMQRRQSMRERVRQFLKIV